MNTPSFGFCEEISLEDACEDINRLEGRKRQSGEGIELSWGNHPIHGKVLVLVPAMGKSIRFYPFENK